MSTINYTYNVIVDRFRQFADGHFQLRRFTHGEISQADLEKEAEWPWMHVKPRAINYSPGTRAFSFEIFISDLPRDKEDKTGYQAESITDCSLIFQDLINEIHLGQMFGDDVVLTRPVNSEPFVEQYTHTLTGVTGIIELNMDYDWSACSIPASWNYNTPTNSPNDGFGALQFIESLDQNGVFVSLLNDVEAPGNSYYYGTNGSGVKGWYASQAGTVTSVDLTAGTGISVSGGPITSSGSITVTNSAPDQVVALSAGTGIGVTGTYPNFTITNSAPSSGGTVTSVAALTLGTTGTDLSSTVATGTTTPVITLNVPTASAVNRGALTSADWTTFNSKVPSTRSLTINGTTQDLSADRTFTIATGLTVGTTPITSGTVGRVLFEGTGNVLQQSANLFWDNTNNRLGIGTASPTGRLQILGSGTTSATNSLVVQNSSATNSLVITDDGKVTIGRTAGAYVEVGTLSNFYNTSVGYNHVFRIGGSEVARIASGGNVLIGTTTDAGFKLDVNGTARVTGNTLISAGNLSIFSTVTSRRLNIQAGNGTQCAITGIYDNGGSLQAAFGIESITTNSFQLASTSAIRFYAGSIIGNIATEPTNERMRIVSNGNVLIGTTTDVASSILTLASTTKGFLPPRMTNAQRLAIATPAVGLIVYCTDVVEGLYINKSTGWTFVI